ncbi:ribbon-helix-helix protein, CopG family [Patescibacteria group bacterium]|nr:MAG: ribbon-helix-helix protein, CopG family [Patescibacteria group bacterium]
MPVKKMKTEKRKRVFVQAKVSDQEKAALDKIAEKENRSMSNLIRLALLQLLEEYEQKKTA